jgi:DNA-binding transcriptional ArsR family regulator
MTDDYGPPDPDPIPEELRADIDMEEYDWKNLDPPDWITDLDREILALLGRTRVIMTPSIIAKNIDGTRSSVSRRLNTLQAGGMVEKVERGHYKISEEGHARMYEEVPLSPPSGRDEDENWITWKVLTPSEKEEVEKKGRLELDS